VTRRKFCESGAVLSRQSESRVTGHRKYARHLFLMSRAMDIAKLPNWDYKDINTFAHVVVVGDENEPATSELLRRLVSDRPKMKALVVAFGPETLANVVAKLDQHHRPLTLLPWTDFDNWLESYRQDWLSISLPQMRELSTKIATTCSEFKSKPHSISRDGDASTTTASAAAATAQTTTTPVATMSTTASSRGVGVGVTGVVDTATDTHDQLDGLGTVLVMYPPDDNSLVKWARFMTNSRHYGVRLIQVIPSARDRELANFMDGIDYIIIDPNIRPLSDAIDPQLLAQDSTDWEEVVVYARSHNLWIVSDRRAVSVPQTFCFLPKSTPSTISAKLDVAAAPSPAQDAKAIVIAPDNPAPVVAPASSAIVAPAVPASPDL
jgi:hypothetical protein